MPCKRYRVSFTRKGKRLITSVKFNKKPTANKYKDSLNKNLTGANARVIQDNDKWKTPYDVAWKKYKKYKAKRRKK